jgi:hypothetical protein
MTAHLTSPYVTVKGFKKCCISSALDETDGVMWWNGSEGDGVIRSKCEEDEGTDSEDGDSDTKW